MRRTRLITVCGACFKASCWHGEFLCAGSASASTVQKTSAELRRLDLEHPSHFSRANVERVCGGSDWAASTPSRAEGA